MSDYVARSPDVVHAVRAAGLTQQELARRAGVARETLSRWESGAQRPSLESLDRLATAVGANLKVSLEPAEPELVALAEDQLELPPAKRPKALLGRDWPACRKALSVAAELGEAALVIGPTAAVLCGAPQRPFHGRVDLLVAYTDQERVADRLFELGGWPDGGEEMREVGERRGRWRVGRGRLTVRTHASGVDDVGALRARAWRVALDRGENGRCLYVPSVSDLLGIVERSPWSEDAIYRAGLRAVLASSRYWSNEAIETGLAA